MTTLDDHDVPDSAHAGGEHGSGFAAPIGRRGFLTFLVAAPTLSLAAKVVLDAPPAEAAIPSLPSVEEILDIAGAIQLAATPTMPLVTLDIGPDGIARLDLPRVELGQGLTTSVAMMIAEDLDASLDQVKVTIADARPELLFNQMTAGSCTLRVFQAPIQAMASQARARMLVAAGKRWGLPYTALSVRAGVVSGPGGRTATYGSLSAEAAAVSMAGVVVTPKAQSTYTVVGRPTKRVDTRDIVTGAKKFSMDLMPTTAKPAMVRRPPTMAGTVTSVNNAATVRALSGVRAVVQIPTGVAVVADTFEQARRGVNALDVTFGPGPIDGESNATMLAELKQRVLPFVVPPLGALTVEAEFDWAPANHAFMETECAVADVRANSAEVWSGFQAPILAQQAIAVELGLPQNAVTAHVVPPGGGFGRRVFFDAALEAAQISKGAGMPVRLMWHRTDDMRHGRVRPQSYHRIRATVVLGQVVAFEQRIAAVSTDFRQGLGDILTYTATSFPQPARDAIGNDAFGQAVLLTFVSSPYNFGVYDKTLSEMSNGMPTASYRSVPNQYTRGSEEILVDEIAAALGQDPVAFRMSTLKNSRTRAVLQKAAQVAGWGKTMPPGFGQGVGIHEEGRAYTASIVELDGRDPQNPKVTKVTLVVDVGLPVNPLGIEAQMHGNIAEAISLTLRAGLHVENGLPLEGSYHNYHWLRMKDYPKDVTIVVMPANSADMGGIGEVGMTAPTGAIANAYGKATGIKPRHFPLVFPVDFEPYPPGFIPAPPYLTA